MLMVELRLHTPAEGYSSSGSCRRGIPPAAPPPVGSIDDRNGNRPGLPLSVTLSFPSWFSPLFLAIFASRLEDARAAAVVFWSLYQLARVVWQPEAGRFSVNRSREDRRRAIYARPRNEGCLGTLHGKTFRMRSMPVFSPPTPVSVSPNPDNS